MVTIGAYDGVHLGHRQVISHVLGLAEAQQADSVIVTFDRHPASVVRPESAPKLLTDLPQKLELLESTGVDHVVVVHFDQERATETAEDFVSDVLVGMLSAATVVVGSDFHFGKGRAGNVALLEAMGAAHEFEVVPFALVSDAAQGGVVSSTRIRRLIAEGDLPSAARLLGRPHEVRGEIVAPHAAQWAVAVPEDILLPPAGAYEARVGCGDELRRRIVVVPGDGGPVVVGSAPVEDCLETTARIIFDPVD